MAITTNKYTSNTYRLSILIAQDGLSFCTAKPAGEVINFSEKKFDEQLPPAVMLTKLIPEIEKLCKTYDYHEVIAIYAHTLYTLVPEEVFDEKQLSHYLKFNIRLLETDFIAYDHLPDIAAKNVFIPLTNINNYLFEKFGSFTFTHSTTLLINGMNVLFENDRPQALVQVYSHHFDVCIVQKGTLLMANSFAYFSPEDFIYYLLFVLEQLKISTSEIEVKLCGKIEENTPIYQYLDTYIEHLEFLRPGTDIPNIGHPLLREQAYYKNHLIIHSLQCG